MSAPPPRVPLDTLRAALSAAVEAKSLRTVAKTIGLSASGLRNIIDGVVEPQPGTLRKLARWHATHEAMRERVTLDDARSALAVLLDGLSTKRANAVQRAFLTSLRTAFKEDGEPPPAWLAEIGHK